MAEAAKTTTPKPRTRATATSKTTARPTPAAKAAAPVEESTAAGKPFVFALDENGETKTYRKFSPPKSSGCVGTLYVPLGVTDVKVALVGDTEE